MFQGPRERVLLLPAPVRFFSCRPTPLTTTLFPFLRHILQALRALALGCAPAGTANATAA
jgi:hypothetical protein